eukprot:42218-Eustigmatos_ZCMA.PRE.1
MSRSKLQKTVLDKHDSPLLQRLHRTPQLHDGLGWVRRRRCLLLTKQVHSTSATAKPQQQPCPEDNGRMRQELIPSHTGQHGAPAVSEGQGPSQLPSPYTGASDALMHEYETL